MTYGGNQHDMRCLLDIDLALFNDVCSFTPFSISRKLAISIESGEDSLQQATQSLSMTRIQDTPLPPPTFSFLKPRPQQAPSLEDAPMSSPITDAVGDIPDVSRGILLLLSEWEIGSDPELPGGVIPHLQPMSKGRRDRAHKSFVEERQRRDPSPQTQSQSFSARMRFGLVPAAPLIRTSREVNLGTSGSTQVPIAVAETRSTSSRVDLATRSQDTDFLGISTQILPGKHGGRSKGGSKKPKKRMGGF